MKSELLAHINSRFLMLQLSQSTPWLATLVDPGYRGQLLSPAKMITVTGWLIEQACNTQVQPSSLSTDNMSARVIA